MREERDEKKLPLETTTDMIRLILADNQTIFRAGAARVLALEDDMRIVAQCEDMTKLWAAVEGLRGSVAIVGSSLKPDIGALTGPL